MELSKNSLILFAKKLYHNYKNDDINGLSASLTYFIIFAIFPIVVFASTLLGYLDITNKQFFSIFLGILPAEVIELVVIYLEYLSESTNTNILMVSLFFTVYFPMRTMNKLMEGINKVYNVESKRKIRRKIALVIILGIVFFIAVTAILFLLVVGRSILIFLAQYLPISMEFIQSWTTIRFFAMAIIAFVVLTVHYWLLPEVKLYIYEGIPGAVFASVGWLVFSAGFSFYVENMGNYNLLYGTLGAIIVLLIWLRIMVGILLMGAEINFILKQMKSEKNYLKN